MSIKKHTVASVIAAAMLLLFTAGSSMAMCMGGGIGLTPEKQATFDNIMKDHRSKVEPLQNQLWAKETELNALQGNPKAEPAHIEALVKDAAELKTKLNAEREALNETLKKDLGIQMNQGNMCPMMNGMGGMNQGGMMKMHGGKGGRMMNGMNMGSMMDGNATMPMGQMKHGARN